LNSPLKLMPMLKLSGNGCEISKTQGKMLEEKRKKTKKKTSGFFIKPPLINVG
jgi:hypothetical protein